LAGLVESCVLKNVFFLLCVWLSVPVYLIAWQDSRLTWNITPHLSSICLLTHSLQLFICWWCGRWWNCEDGNDGWWQSVSHISRFPFLSVSCYDALCGQCWWHLCL